MKSQYKKTIRTGRNRKTSIYEYRGIEYMVDVDPSTPTHIIASIHETERNRIDKKLKPKKDNYNGNGHDLDDFFKLIEEDSK